MLFMNLRDFRRAGHLPTLFCSFLYFDISFMVWVILGALANAIVPDYGLAPAQKGLMVAVPRPGAAPHQPDARVLRALREGQPEPAGPQTAVGLRGRAAARRYLVVLPVLLGDVRRLRRAGELPEHLLPRPVRPEPRQRRLLHD